MTTITTVLLLRTQHWKNITVTNITVTLITLWWLESLSISLSHGVEEYHNSVWSYSSNCAREHSWDEKEQHRNYGQRSDSLREEVHEKTRRHPEMY